MSLVGSGGLVRMLELRCETVEFMDDRDVLLSAGVFMARQRVIRRA